MSYGQDSLLKTIFPIVEEKVHYEKVADIKDAAKTLLFQRGKVWALGLLKSSKDALQSEDKELGLVYYKTSFTVTFLEPPFKKESNDYKPDEQLYNFTLKM